MGIFYAPKLLLKQKAVGLLAFHAALFILKDELNSCKEKTLVTVFVFNFRKSVRFPGQSWRGGGFPIDERKLSLPFYSYAFRKL